MGGVVGVDGGGGQARDGVDEGVFCGDGQAWACTTVRWGSTTMSASARRVWPIQRIRTRPDVEYAVDVAQRVFGAVDQGGVDGVHQAPVDLAGGVLEGQEDRER